MCSGRSRRASRPPCTFGCSVFTRPSSISGKAGVVGDFGDRQAGVGAAASRCRRSRGCLTPSRGQRAREVDDAGLVGNGDERLLDHGDEIEGAVGSGDACDCGDQAVCARCSFLRSVLRLMPSIRRPALVASAASSPLRAAAFRPRRGPCRTRRAGRAAQVLEIVLQALADAFFDAVSCSCGYRSVSFCSSQRFFSCRARRDAGRRRRHRRGGRTTPLGVEEFVDGAQLRLAVVSSSVHRARNLRRPKGRARTSRCACARCARPVNSP